MAELIIRPVGLKRGARLNVRPLFTKQEEPMSTRSVIARARNSEGEFSGRYILVIPRKPKLTRGGPRRWRPEPAQVFTHKNILKSETDLEWLFVFDETRNRLVVRE